MIASASINEAVCYKTKGNTAGGTLGTHHRAPHGTAIIYLSKRNAGGIAVPLSEDVANATARHDLKPAAALPDPEGDFQVLCTPDVHAQVICAELCKPFPVYTLKSQAICNLRACAHVCVCV